LVVDAEGVARLGVYVCSNQTREIAAVARV